MEQSLLMLWKRNSWQMGAYRLNTTCCHLMNKVLIGIGTNPLVYILSLLTHNNRENRVIEAGTTWSSRISTNYGPLQKIVQFCSRNTGSLLGFFKSSKWVCSLSSHSFNCNSHCSPMRADSTMRAGQRQVLWPAYVLQKFICWRPTYQSGKLWYLEVEAYGRMQWDQDGRVAIKTWLIP